MPSILVPLAPNRVKQGDEDWFGVIEIDAETGDEVWRFDAQEEGYGPSELVQVRDQVRQKGFRPAGVERLDSGLTVIAGYDKVLFVDEDGHVVDELSHQLFNDVHEVKQTSDGTYLVASTGMDTIIELDNDFNEVWRWHMWEYVDNSCKPHDYYPEAYTGIEVRNHAFDPYNRFHLNYVHEPEDGILLCSALNYGIFTINKDTGHILCENKDLDECHNPYQLGGTYAVCESGKDRVVLVDWSEKYEVMFDGRLDFVKDADPMGRTKDWLITDTKNDRLLVWNRDEDEPRKEFNLGSHSNPYEADYIEDEDLSHA